MYYVQEVKTSKIIALFKRVKAARRFFAGLRPGMSYVLVNVRGREF